MAMIIWSDHALESLRAQARYIVEQSCSAEIALRWANDVCGEADRLADFPDIGHPIPEISETPYREIIIRKNFRLIYRRSHDVCYIVTVRRCSMLLDETTIAELDSV